VCPFAGMFVGVTSSGLLKSEAENDLGWVRTNAAPITTTAAMSATPVHRIIGLMPERSPEFALDARPPDARRRLSSARRSCLAESSGCGGVALRPLP
jgi:hypothetical protein